jgi:hypothetical protein
VCIGISDSGDLISKEIFAASTKEASSLFSEQCGIAIKNIHGPFYKKKAQVLENTRTLKFSSEVKRAEYNGWIVNAMILIEPADHAFVVFFNRIDGVKAPKPQGTIVVPVSNLRIINNG